MTMTTRMLAIVATIDTLSRDRPKGQAAKPPENTYGLPTARPLAAKLREWMDRQRKEVLGTIPTLGTELPTHFPPMANYDDRMASAMTPILGSYWDESGRETRARLGLDPDDWRVTNPHTEAMIRGQAMGFCRETNRTTSSNLTDALAKLRDELVAGVVENGESLNQLTRRVNAVFDNAESWRARSIAATEASRAVHAAQERSAIESGVVAGFEWLVSGDACPLCRMVATEAKQVRAGQAFAVVGDNPAYSTIRHPPLHPGCQCAMIEVLTPEYGGPEDPQWAETLDQPKPGIEYRPPPGTKEATPEPKRLDAAPPPYPLKVYGPASSSTRTDAEKVLAAMPDKARDILRAAGVEVAIAHKMADIAPDIVNDHPRGWPPGSTWANVDGAFRNGKLQAFACETYVSRMTGKVQKSQRVPSVLRHEIGHALDHSLGHASQAQGFRAAYHEDVKNLASTAKLDYYLQHGNAGPSEAFAEIFGQAHGGGCGQVDLLIAFPRSADFIRNLMK